MKLEPKRASSPKYPATSELSKLAPVRRAAIASLLIGSAVLVGCRKEEPTMPGKMPMPTSPKNQNSSEKKDTDSTNKNEQKADSSKPDSSTKEK